MSEEEKHITVAQLIEWLKTQDQEAWVEVVRKVEGRSYNGDSAEAVWFDPENHSNYTDFRGNQFVKPDAPNYNRRHLLLGEL